MGVIKAPEKRTTKSAYTIPYMAFTRNLQYRVMTVCRHPPLSQAYLKESARSQLTNDLPVRVMIPTPSPSRRYCFASICHGTVCGQETFVWGTFSRGGNVNCVTFDALKGGFVNEACSGLSHPWGWVRLAGLPFPPVRNLVCESIAGRT